MPRPASFSVSAGIDPEVHARGSVEPAQERIDVERPVTSSMIVEIFSTYVECVFTRI